MHLTKNFIIISIILILFNITSFSDEIKYDKFDNENPYIRVCLLPKDTAEEETYINFKGVHIIRNGFNYNNIVKKIDKPKEYRIKFETKMFEISKSIDDNNLNDKICYIDNDDVYIINENYNEKIFLNSYNNFISGFYFYDRYTNKLEFIISKNVCVDSLYLFSHFNNDYRGGIILDELSNNIIPINLILIEKYLYSVVGGEMPNSFEIEALKSQAVAARTYSIKQKKENSSFDVYNSVLSQTYKGIKSESPKINNAVDDTKNLIMKYNDKVIDALYSSTNGGYQASAKEVYGYNHEYLISKYDEYSLNNKYTNWELNITFNEIEKIFNKYSYNINRIYKIEVLQKSDSNRIMKMKIYGNRELEITGSEFRRILGNDIKSTMFDIFEYGDNEKFYDLKNSSFKSDDFYVINNNGIVNILEKDIYIINENEKIIKSDRNIPAIFENEILSKKENNSFEFNTKTVPYCVNTNKISIRGNGYGHGVGMSQYGANEMSKSGKNFIDILKYYYNNIVIDKIK